MITGRYYFSKKYTSFDMTNLGEGLSLKYKPNTTLNMGVGATYRWATLNLAYGFDFLNPNEDKGKTRYLDLQVHNYGRKIIIDLFGQFYRGFYLEEEALRKENGDYYQRPDVVVRVFGASGQYLLNHGQFSYRAAFLQNEWQKKSAGSMLVGWEFFFGQGRADSTFVPNAFNDSDAEVQLNRLSFIETGPNVGYAYTLVFKKNFFVTGSGSVSFDFGSNVVEGPGGRTRSSSFSPNTFVRFFTGYNSEKWALSFTFVNQVVRITTDADTRRVNLNTGNFRFNAVYRFAPGRKTRKVLKDVMEVVE